ncbi:Diguanylate cyclase/phosphodiesterase [Paracholeplasma brassicae]|uniref:Diguanylate cyclase/phosphodiesterase n=1 Tax=Acholeplasma brassicae TaxID=61635 RepID=U4KNN8_9MOLU|nr:EAL domain-containing protein [Paracholeplasma brassicae]CCV65972.1 Diguanylate cyclase/phosphodiesterase [Paracholeplasma brassicae]
MKRFQIRLSIFMILGFSVLSALLYSSFFLITNNFLKERTTDNLSLIGESMNTHLSSTFKKDYDAFLVYLDAHMNDVNPIDGLNDHKESVTFNGLTPVTFGKKEGNTLSLFGESLVYQQVFFETNYFQIPVSIYPLSTVFNTEDQTNYVVFTSNDYVMLLDANAYVENIFNSNHASSYQSYIISQDGYVFISSDQQYSTTKFGNHFLLEVERKDFFLNLRSNQSGLIETTYLDEVSFITFNEVNYDSLEPIYFVNVFLYDDVIGSNQALIETLILIFSLSVVLFIGFLLLGYKLVEMKVADIENSRFKFYYDKPMMVKINRYGKILKKNRSFKETIVAHDKLVSVRDFLLVEDNQNPLDIIKRQKVLSTRFDLEKHQLYLRFIPLKTTFGYLLVADNYTKLELKFQSYRSIAHFNSISKLPNINHLKYDLAAYVSQTETHSNKNALLVFSMVNFTSYVKLLGEVVVNKMIINIRNTTLELLKNKNATLYNLYQDHFAIFFKDLASYEDIKPFVEKLSQTLEQTIDVDENNFLLDFRFGVFNLEHDNYVSLNQDEIYDNAMLALNKCKTLLTSKLVTYDITLGQFVNKKEQMERDLIEAIEKEEFVMFLQPQYSTVSDRIVGFEALIRWDNKKYLSTSPEEYISLAESNNLIIDIGRQIMHQTFKMAKALESYDINISMNISPVQMLQAGFTNEFMQIYQSYDLKPNSISIEVTETFLMTSFELIIEKLKILQRFGVSIHLDDFGTGYSSLLYLKELPIDSIKIDRKFIMYALSDKYSKAIINMIISLAKNLDLEVIAEGVEDDKQYQLLKKSGCNTVQGFYIGKAMRFDDAVVLLNEFSLDKLSKKKEVK